MLIEVGLIILLFYSQLYSLSVSIDDIRINLTLFESALPGWSCTFVLFSCRCQLGMLLWDFKAVFDRC